MVITAPRATSIIYNFLKSNSRGGYYLLPVNICPIVPLAFMKACVEFKFVDIDEASWCLGYGGIEKHISNQDCEGMIFVYTYGVKIQHDSMFEAIKKQRPDFIIIEDKCLSIPSFSLNEASANATLTLYSTGYAKFCELGYGGFALSHFNIEYKIHACEYVANDLEAITSEYKHSLFHHEQFNYDSSLNWLENNNCKWILEDYLQLVNTELNAIIPVKAKLNSLYSELIPEIAWLTTDHMQSSDWRFQIRVEQRDKLLQLVFNQSLFASAHYQCLDGIFSDEQIDVKNAKKLEGEILNLFNDRHFSLEQAKALAMIISEHLLKHN